MLSGPLLYFLAASSAYEHQPELGQDVLKQTGRIRDKRLTEISGMVMSVENPGCFWVHNDSGNPAELFLVAIDGTVLAHVELSGAQNRDWEDICIFQHEQKNYLCVGDVGDNLGRRKSYTLYVVAEPRIDPAKSPQDRKAEAVRLTLVSADIKKLQFKYEDGPKNCEAFDFDHETRSFLLAEKGFDRRRKQGLGIYQLKVDDELNVAADGLARRIASCPIGNSTAMSISGDGRRMIIASYAGSVLYHRPEQQDWITTIKQQKARMMPMPMQRQGEAIALNRTGDQAFTTSEHVNQPIWQIQVDAAVDSVAPDNKESDQTDE